MSYEPKSYWEERLRQSFSLKHTGHIGFSLVYNKWSYKAKARVLENALSGLNINCKGKAVLDVGCGTGFWVEFYKSNGAATRVGVDTPGRRWEQSYEFSAQCEFYELDIG